MIKNVPLSQNKEFGSKKKKKSRECQILNLDFSTLKLRDFNMLM